MGVLLKIKKGFYQQFMSKMLLSATSISLGIILGGGSRGIFCDETFRNAVLSQNDENCNGVPEPFFFLASM
jgi:hypothetical protein